MDIQKTDVIIVGAGPVGLYAVAQIGMQARFSCHVVDSLDKPGGQPAELYPDKPIYDIPALPSVSGHQLTENLLEQCKPFNPVFHLGEAVRKLSKADDGEWLLETDADTCIKAPTIVVSSGRGLFDPRKPKIANVGDFENSSVFYAVRKGVRERVRGKDLVIAGGGDSALDWTLALVDEARSLTLMHRRPSFRAAEDSVAKLKELIHDRRVSFFVGQATDLIGKGGALEAVRVKSATDGSFDLKADIFMPFFGMTPKMGALEQWDLDIVNGKIAIDIKHCSTNIPGIFAIGDCAVYDGKQELILTGFQEAAHATAGVYKHIHGKDLKVQFTTSSSEILSALGAEKAVEQLEKLDFVTPLEELLSKGRAERVLEGADG